MFIGYRLLFYISVFVVGFSFYYIGANRGYDLGVKDGVSDFLLVGLRRGTVSCHYVKLEKKNDNKSIIVAPGTSSLLDLRDSGSTGQK